MNRSVAWRAVFGFVLLVGPAGLTAFPASPAKAAPPQVYIALGDSIAAGVATTLPRERGYPALVAKLLRDANDPDAEIRLVNLGVPGETAASFSAQGQLDRFRAEVAQIKQQAADLRLITITLGGNEMLQLARLGSAERQAGLDEFRRTFPAALTSVRDALGDARPVIVVTTYYEVSEGDPGHVGSDAWWLAQFNQVIRQTAAEHGAQVADVEPVFRAHIRDWTWYPADVHPNNEGHAQIARLVWQATGIDTRPPEISIERPVAGALSRQIPTVRASVRDDTGVAQVELLVDNQYVSDLIPVACNDAYLGIWDGRRYAGQHPRLTVRALDRAGNEASVSVAVTMPGT